MANSTFRFRQFQVSHDRCAMKVGTDGVLLGAWAHTEGARRILDIGTGCGLIALMVAQREPSAWVVGIEIDPSAALQASENVAGSPFASRISIYCQDVRIFQSEERFDHIVCNPPFFTEDTLPPDAARAQARNVTRLQFSDLLKAAARLLSEDGFFHVIIPTSSYNMFVNQAFIDGLFVVRSCLVHTTERKAPKRQLLTLSRRGPVASESERLVLTDAQGRRSADYACLTRDFYL